MGICIERIPIFYKRFFYINIVLTKIKKNKILKWQK